MRIIAGEFRSRTLIAPRGDKTRPTTDRAREAVFNVLSNQLNWSETRVLDLFAGSGALAFEALSRGALQATLVENNRFALHAAKENAAALGVQQAVRQLPNDVYKFLQSPARGEFELIFADPPYSDGRTQTELPELIFANGWLAPGGLCVIEHRAGQAALAPKGAKILRELNAGEAGFTILVHQSKENISQ